MNVLTVPTKSQLFSKSSSNLSLSSFLSEDIVTKSPKEKVLLLLVRDLLRLGWKFKSGSKGKFELVAPDSYEKIIVRKAMAYSRNEVIRDNEQWIKSHIDLARKNLASGLDVLTSPVIPRLEACETQNQNDIFRIFRYYWSSPASDYVGRRIRVIIRDDGIAGSPVIGIAAIGSSIIHIADRDNWIGWDIKTRTDRIIYMMDAYVVGALPPYNSLLGGKLIAYLLASNELREIYKNKYSKSKTIINERRKAFDMAMIVTTSLYGLNSSQYNRLKYGKSLICKPIGTTSGYGSLHISNETFSAMRELVKSKGYTISHEFGMGPNWRMRLIRTACDILELDSNTILKHSFHRGLFAIPLTINWKSFLVGKAKHPTYRNLPLKKLVAFWKRRWFDMRKQNSDIVQKVAEFSPEQFDINLTDVSGTEDTA